MHVVVDIGQGRVDTTVRGGNDAVDDNQLFHGNDRVDTLALDLANSYHLFTAGYGLHTITHGHLSSSNKWQGGKSTSTGRQDMIHGHLEVTTRFSRDLGKGGLFFVAAVGKVSHIRVHLFALGIDRQHTITHLHIRHSFGFPVFNGDHLGAHEARGCGGTGRGSCEADDAKCHVHTCQQTTALTGREAGDGSGGDTSSSGDGLSESGLEGRGSGCGESDTYNVLRARDGTPTRTKKKDMRGKRKVLKEGLGKGEGNEEGIGNEEGGREGKSRDIGDETG